MSEEEVREYSNIGIQSDEIQRQESLRLSDAEREEKLYRDLQRFQRAGTLLWGEVYGVEESDALQDRALIAVLWNGLKVAIPDNEYFEDTYDFGRQIQSMDDHARMVRRMYAARNQIGAKVCFVILGVSRTKIREGGFADEYEYVVVASRRRAMAILRDIWFLHEERPETARAGREIRVNDIIREAHVLAVNERNVLVECLGVETRIDAYNLTNRDVVENCTDFAQAGDTMPVRVRKLHVEPGRVYLTVSGRLNESSKLIGSMRKGAVYLGHVDHYNKAKDRYTIVLKNGVYGTATSGQVQGGIPLNPGDRVAFRVTEIKPEYLIGVVMKL